MEYIIKNTPKEKITLLEIATLFNRNDIEIYLKQILKNYYQIQNIYSINTSLTRNRIVELTSINNAIKNNYKDKKFQDN